MIWLNSLMSCPFRLLSQNVTDWVAYQQHNLFLTVLGVWHPRLRCLQIWCLGRPDFWFWDTCLLAVSSWGGKNGELSRISCMRARVPFLRTPPSWLNHLPKASTSNTITLGLGFRVWTWGGGHKPSVYEKALRQTSVSHCDFPIISALFLYLPWFLWLQVNSTSLKDCFTEGGFQRDSSLA